MSWTQVNICLTLVAFWGIVTCEYCDKEVVRAGNTILIYSQNFPLEYDSDIDQCWEIATTDGGPVTLQFHDGFHTERNIDDVTIYEMESSGYTEIDVLSGNENSYDWHSTFTTQGDMKVTFVTDGSIEERGWQACLCHGDLSSCDGCQWVEYADSDTDSFSSVSPFSIVTFIVPVVVFLVVIVIIIVVVQMRKRQNRSSRGVGTATVMQPVQQQPQNGTQQPQMNPQQPYTPPPYHQQPYPQLYPNQSYPNQPYPNQPYSNQPYQNPNSNQPPAQQPPPFQQEPQPNQPTAPPAGNEPYIGGGSTQDMAQPPSYEEATKPS